MLPRHNNNNYYYYYYNYNGKDNGKDIFNVHWPNSLGLIEGFCTK